MINAVCIDTSFESANMQKAKANFSYFQGARFNHADCRESTFIQSNFKSAILYFTNLQAADLRGANFTKATFDRVKFTGSDLRNANFEEAIGLDSKNDLIKKIIDINGANIHNIKASKRFIDWALSNNAIEEKNTDRIIFHSLQSLYRRGKTFEYH